MWFIFSSSKKNSLLNGMKILWVLKISWETGVQKGQNSVRFCLTVWGMACMVPGGVSCSVCDAVIQFIEIFSCTVFVHVHVQYLYMYSFLIRGVSRYFFTLSMLGKHFQQIFWTFLSLFFSQKIGFDILYTGTSCQIQVFWKKKIRKVLR